MRVLVANSNRLSTRGSCGSLSLVDTTAALRGRPASLGLIPARAFPRQIVLEPGGRVLLVTNYSSAQLEAIDLSRLP
jgi:hypothetical protein